MIYAVLGAAFVSGTLGFLGGVTTVEALVRRRFKNKIVPCGDRTYRVVEVEFFDHIGKKDDSLPQ